jgi:hypothetical protein
MSSAVRRQPAKRAAPSLQPPAEICIKADFSAGENAFSKIVPVPAVRRYERTHTFPKLFTAFDYGC